MKVLQNKDFQTRAVHAGERQRQENYTPVSTPVWSSVGYLYESMDDLDAVFEGTKNGYVYPRYASPTVAAFEQAVASLEKGSSAQAYGSGMAAIHAAVLASGVKSGSSIVAAMDLYGASYTLLRSLFTSLGLNVHFVDVCNLKEVEEAVSVYQPGCVLVETISNPLLKVADISSLAEIAHHFGAALLVDNTFASPYLFNPIEAGADFVIHSATKYLSGHGDVMAGVVVTSHENKLKLYELNKLVGSVLGPFDAWLALRGLKTLPLRMREQCHNAQRVAEWLYKHPRIVKVYYPGLKNHSQHELARIQFRGNGYGGVLTFEISGADKRTAFRFMEALELCLPATTLGDVYSLILHPATSSHRSLTLEERKKIGITDGLVRLSTGIEFYEDIIADLDQALNSL